MHSMLPWAGSETPGQQFLLSEHYKGNVITLIWWQRERANSQYAVNALTLRPGRANLLLICRSFSSFLSPPPISLSLRHSRGKNRSRDPIRGYMISSALKTPKQDSISMQHTYFKKRGKIVFSSFFERERDTHHNLLHGLRHSHCGVICINIF